LKQLWEVVGNTLELIGIGGNDFLNRTQKAQHLRERMNKQNCIKLKIFCTTKETVTRLKRLPTKWEKIFVIYSSDKGLISRIYKELKKLNLQRIILSLMKCAYELNKDSQRKRYKWLINT
jgi:hypothetical protein